MGELGSVTIWLNRLKSGEERDEAVSRLWGRYFTQLVTRARERLRSRVTDGEDVALSAFDSFVRAVEAGRFPQLDDRDDLWQVLLLLTARKAANVARDEHRLKKGGGQVIIGFGNGGPEGAEPAATSLEPDPAEAVILADEADQLLRILGTDELRRVAVWAMEGYSNEEIANHMGKSVATAERKLRRIRDIWSEYIRGDRDGSEAPGRPVGGTGSGQPISGPPAEQHQGY
jgi:DNA-directed RNA polymerase specialized sigma24 family protein